MDRLRATQRPIYDAIRKHGPITDAELCQLLHSTGSKIRPRRLDLFRLGLVRSAGEKPLEGGPRKARLWELVPPEEVEQAQQEAGEVPPRRRKISDLPLETRLKVVRALLRDDEVHASLLASKDRASSRARARARDTKRQAERERRERIAQIQDQEREQGELVEFLKARDHLKRNVEAVRAVCEFLARELARQRELGNSKIPLWVWPYVLELLAEVMDMAEPTYDLIADLLGAERRGANPATELEEDEIIEAEVISPLELADGSLDYRPADAGADG